MSLLSSFRKPAAPKVVPLERPAPMEIGGLQLECPVCSYDQFRRHQLVVLDASAAPVTWQTGRFVPVNAVACDRCGALQLFHPASRSHPDQPIPPRRVAHLRHRPDAPAQEWDDDEAEDAVDDEVDQEVLAEPTWDDPLVGSEEVLAVGDDPGSLDQAGEDEPPQEAAFDWEPSAEAEPSPGPSIAGTGLSPSQAWPVPLPPLPPLPPLAPPPADPG